MISCEKNDPNPEKSDRIYSDLLAEAGKVEKEVSDVENRIKEIQVQKSEALASNYYNQAKNHTQRIHTAESEAELLRQKKMYYISKAGDRAEYVRKKYLEYLKSGGEWPLTSEYDDYSRLKKAEKNRFKEWSNRNRVEIYKRK